MGRIIFEISSSSFAPRISTVSSYRRRRIAQASPPRHYKIANDDKLIALYVYKVDTMIEGLVGYVSGNRKREQIIQALSNGALEMNKIAKMVRMPERSAIKLLGDLEKKGLIKADGGTYSLTETGVEVENRIRGM